MYTTRVRDFSKPEPPKRPVNAYFLFSAERRPQFKAQYPHKNQAELSKMMAAAYRDLSHQKRRKYEEMYEIAKKNYDRDYHTYIEKYGRPHKKQSYEDRLEEKYERAKKQWEQDYNEYAAKYAHLNPMENDDKENDYYRENVVKRPHRSPKIKSKPIEISDEEESEDDESYGCEVEIKEQNQKEIFEENYSPYANDNPGPEIVEEEMAEEIVEVTKPKNEAFKQKIAEEKIEDAKHKNRASNLKMTEEKVKEVRLNSEAFNLFDLYSVKSFIDIVFEVDDKDFSAHKLILAKRCKFFDDLFKSGISDGYRLKISDAKPEHFEALLRFIYGDPNLTVDVDSARELLALSEKYLVPALKTNCELALMRLLSVKNFAKIAKSAEAMHSTSLKKALCKFVARNAPILKGDLSGLPKPVLVQIFTGFAALAR